MSFDEHDCVQKERIAALETESKTYKGLLERLQDKFIDEIFERLRILEQKYAVLNVKMTAIGIIGSLAGGIIGVIIGKYIVK